MMKLRLCRAVGKDGHATGSKVMVVAVAFVLAMLVTIIFVPSVTLANDGDIRFTGTVTDRYPEGWIGTRWWNVTVGEVISGPTPCPELVVRLIFVPPWGYFDDDIAIGDTVEVYGSYNSTNCRVSLNGNVEYYITKIPVQEPVLDTGPLVDPYPSISGIHNGTITPLLDINVSKMYTYSCPGTGGHTEYVKIWNNTGWNVTATWKGYSGDWHNITFNESFTLYAGTTYNYSICTGSYPQIHQNRTLSTESGWINCTKFEDANGNVYTDWIPAIRLY
jgi:hypothetical protein